MLGPKWYDMSYCDQENSSLHIAESYALEVRDFASARPFAMSKAIAFLPTSTHC